jgi:mannose-6-phosphate isomerase-like protein (cupin superfamily)
MTVTGGQQRENTMTVAARNLDTPDQKRTYQHGVLHLVTVGGATVARGVYAPGWRWSTDVRPEVGTDSCQVPHTGYVLSGRLGIRMDDGTEMELGPGDGHVVGPGHDAWVVGDEPVVIIDVAPAPPETTRS